MKRWRARISAFLAALMLFACMGTGSAMAEDTPTEDVNAAEALTLADIEVLGAKVYTQDGRLTFVDGACTEEPIRSMEDAAKVLSAVSPLLGGDERIHFVPWRMLTDSAGNVYYLFRQMYADTTVSGGAVKLVTDADGSMLGLVASVEDELPDIEQAESITARQAEELVLERMSAGDQVEVGLIEGQTEKVILPVNLNPDFFPEEEKPVERRFVWAVYTENSSGDVRKGVELPFLVHYVTMDGKYVCKQPAICPGDETAASGYDAAYVFEFMEPADYTGTVTLSDGSAQEISVMLMRDTRTGMYYLGNLERRIVVADYYEFIYNSGRVQLEASVDNSGWDETCLLSLYNYCRAWDYYRELGWIGGDGLGTPILILKDYCKYDYQPLDNACYAGPFYGWEAFISSSANDYSQCLDVLAHEFTHCVTNATMTYNDYKNDHGAINEAISDIHGNLCEMMAGATEDTTWALGENSVLGIIRSMSDPHMFQQPAYTWDLYYWPNVKELTVINDRGGVHINSSILNSVAWQLCAESGMTLEEARAFWFAVDCAIVPGTDYPQLRQLLPWIMEYLDMARYQEALSDAMDATRLGVNEIPEAFEDDRALVKLTLPDDERFTDGHWQLRLFNVDSKGAAQRCADIMAGRGEYAGVLDELLAAIYGVDPEALEKDARDYTADEILDALFTKLAESLDPGSIGTSDGTGDLPAEEVPQDSNDFLTLLKVLYARYFADLISVDYGNAGEDGRTIQAVVRPGLTLPLLYRAEADDEGYVHSMSLAVYTFEEWHDLFSIALPILETLMPEQGGEEPDDTAEASADEAAQQGDVAQAPADDEAQVNASNRDDVKKKLFTVLASQEGRDAVKRLIGELDGMLRKIIDPQALVDLILFRIEPGTICALPETGLEAVEVFQNEDFTVLQSLYGMPPVREKAFGGKATVDYGSSELYTREDLKAAVKLIEDEFASFTGCEMHALRYAGDVCGSLENIRWINSLDEGKNYVQVVEFLSDFHSPIEGGGAWEPDTEYTDYQWWLARTVDGDWNLLSWGYA
ncbi:MAG: M4 family metallopeptidase [Oscillospiraceae bacterium]|nr:M4 family metallopeptidase [Oscillospiraceae bacterium]